MRRPQMSAHIIACSRTATLSRAGIESASEITPDPAVLEKFGQVLDATGIRGQPLEVTDRLGAQHSRGPSRWQQRRYRMERNLTATSSGVPSYCGIFSEPQAHGGRHVALDPLCCGEDKHSTPVLSGALLPYPSTTAPAHPPYPSLRIDPAQPHLNSRPQP